MGGCVVGNALEIGGSFASRGTDLLHHELGWTRVRPLAALRDPCAVVLDAF